jgi:hypothetical protein
MIATVLLCLLAQAPTSEECTPSVALKVETFRVASAPACEMLGMQRAAQMAHDVPDEKLIFRIDCEQTA